MKTTILVAVLMSASAFAGGLALEQVPPALEKSLRVQVEQARKLENPTFSLVASLRRDANVLDQKKRGRLAPLTRAFKGFGPQAFWPMVELLVLDAGTGEALNPAAAKALKVGALEALAELKDPRALPVLIAILEQPGTVDFDVQKAAAWSLGALQSDEAAKHLVRLSRNDSVTAMAVQAGMGSCRRAVIAKELSADLSKTTEPKQVKWLTKALGEVGNAWAWKTPSVTFKGEEAQVKAEAAKALMAAFVRGDAEAKSWASNALMVVDAPSTPALILEAKVGADAALAAELDGLAARFARNPTR